jgi:hypothetical protein
VNWGCKKQPEKACKLTAKNKTKMLPDASFTSYSAELADVLLSRKCIATK